MEKERLGAFGPAQVIAPTEKKQGDAKRKGGF